MTTREWVAVGVIGAWLWFVTRPRAVATVQVAPAPAGLYALTWGSVPCASSGYGAAGGQPICVAVRTWHNSQPLGNQTVTVTLCPRRASVLNPQRAPAPTTVSVPIDAAGWGYLQIVDAVPLQVAWTDPGGRDHVIPWTDTPLVTCPSGYYWDPDTHVCQAGGNPR